MQPLNTGTTRKGTQRAYVLLIIERDDYTTNIRLILPEKGVFKQKYAYTRAYYT